MLTRRQLLHSAGGLAVAGALPVSGAANAAARHGATAAKASAPAVGAVRSWAYQLQNYDFRELQACAADLLVVDYSVSGADQNRFSGSAVHRLAVKPDGSRRIVLAYMSIGEAEDYRYYWRPDWLEAEQASEPSDSEKPGKRRPSPEVSEEAPPPQDEKPDSNAGRQKRSLSDTAPSWLGEENESWSGNFAVKYWDPGWQSIILDGPQSYLARIVRAGFDGVYLDRVDAFYDHTDERERADEDMVEFVARIAELSRAMKPGFLVVPQNGEELLSKPRYLALIDAIAKEDLLYGSPDQGKPNAPSQIANSVGWLSYALREGRRVLVVEYLDNPAEVAAAQLQIERLAMVPTFAPRLLDRLSPFAVPAATKPTR